MAVMGELVFDKHSLSIHSLARYCIRHNELVNLELNGKMYFNEVNYRFLTIN